MPRKKPSTFDLSLPLNPDHFYRKGNPFTQAVFGLKPTQIDEMIERGELEPPVKAFEGGRAVGWVGSTLIALQNRRRAQAAIEAERLSNRVANKSRR